MKPIFRTDLSLILLGLASLATGILTHFAGHFAEHDLWHNWSVVHSIVNVGLLIAVAMHIKQHLGWFKKLIKRSSLKAKMAVFVTVAIMLVSFSGMYLLFFVEGQDSHAGLVHYWFGLIFAVLAILHLVRRLKVFRKGVFGVTK